MREKPLRLCAFAACDVSPLSWLNCMNREYVYYHSDIGVLEIVGDDTGIFSVNFVDDAVVPPTPEPCPGVQDCVEQLDEYFRGTRQTFSVTVSPRGSAFQQNVWQHLMTILFGQTTSYQDIARALGHPKASQAVGHANGSNPIAIIIPCHRVLGKNGKLTGYAGGLWRKEWLLRHENAYIL